MICAAIGGATRDAPSAGGGGRRWATENSERKAGKRWIRFVWPDALFRRLLYGYLAGAIFFAWMWVLWAMPSIPWPCGAIGGASDWTPESPHGLFRATSAREHFWSFRGTEISIYPLGFSLTVVATVVVLHYCVLRYFAWLAGRSLSYGEWWAEHLSRMLTDRRTRRRERGQCPDCGYDLRGQLDKGCSECGWGRE